MSAAPYLRADTETHTVTYWHARLHVSRPVEAPAGSEHRDGWYSSEDWHCTHHHRSQRAADECTADAYIHAERHDGNPPAGWEKGSRP